MIPVATVRELVKLGCGPSGVGRCHDGVWTIEDKEALEMTLRLAAEEGIFAGISSGANVVGSLRFAERLPEGSIVVALAVDSGFKYMGGPPYSAAQGAGLAHRVRRRRSPGPAPLT
jgi:hypothetical protein